MSSHNIPYNPYHTSAVAAGFQSAEQDVDVRSPIPLEVEDQLENRHSPVSVKVVAAGDLVETDPTTHTDMDRGLFDKLPLESQSSSLSSLVTLASPGISADSNGLFHGLGDHASNSFSIDGQPITDQQSKVFSNQLPVDAVQSMEVIEGAPPAEYGGKTSVVIVATTRSGLGVDGAARRYNGLLRQLWEFDWKRSISPTAESPGATSFPLNGMNTGRFLDGPEFTVMHDQGNEENVFDRFDFKLSSQDTINLNFGFTRSWFQTPNSFDAQNATAWSGPVCSNYLGYSNTCNGLGPNGQPVGPRISVRRSGPSILRPRGRVLLNANTVFTLGGFARQDQYNYYPSADPFADLTPDLQLQTVGQNRRLTNLGGHANVSYVKGIHNMKVGVNYSNTILTENDTYRDRRSDSERGLFECRRESRLEPVADESNGCTGALQQNPGFVPLLACYDLTRTAPLPASDGCPNSTTGLYTFNGHADIRETALYLQDTITKDNWTFNLGLRGDFYHGITSATQAEPRLGIAYRIKPTSTVLRVSYARTMETPFNENLVLASLGCNDPVINALQAPVPGGPCVSTTPLSPGHRNEFHAGLQQAFGRYLRGGWRIYLEIHTQGFRFQRAGRHADHLSHRVDQFEDPRLCDPRQPFRTSTAFRLRGYVQRGGALFRTAGQRNWRDARGDHRVPHRPRREFQPDHSSAIPALEERALVQLQLALRQRPGCRPGAVCGRQLRERAEWDR